MSKKKCMLDVSPIQKNKFTCCCLCKSGVWLFIRPKVAVAAW